MAIRPIDVRRKEFKSGFRGYDANQVDDFLDQVADEFERTYTDNQRMREEVSSLRERLQQFEDLEGSIRSALVHAEQAANDLRKSSQREADELKISSQRDADNLRLSSQKEAELTIQEAQNRSHQMLADSSGRVERIQESYEALVEAKREFKNDFRQVLKTYLDVMEDMEVSTAKGIESSLRNRLDTESIAVAREAAASDSATDETTSGGISSGSDRNESEFAAATGLQRQAGSDDVQGGPLYEDDSSPESSTGGYEETADSTDETQRIDLSELPNQQSPETSTATGNTDDTSDFTEPTGRDEYDGENIRQENGNGLDADDPSYEDRSDDRAEDDFFDRDRQDEEAKDDSRIFRASRFLRRRD